MGQNSSEVRRELYAFLADECGIKVNPEQHKKLKQFMLSHANAQTEDLLKEIENLKVAVAKKKEIAQKKHQSRR